MADQNLVIEHALLGFLRERPLHGYEIYQRLCAPQSLWLVWRIKQSRLYAMLDRLEKKGFIESRLEMQESRPARKILMLTNAGRAAFEKWMQSPVPRGRQLRLEFQARLFFALETDSHAALELIVQQTELCETWLEEEEQAALNAQKNKPFNWLVHQFRIGQLEAMQTWLNLCIDTVQNEALEAA